MSTVTQVTSQQPTDASPSKSRRRADWKAWVAFGLSFAAFAAWAAYKFETDPSMAPGFLMGCALAAVAAVGYFASSLAHRLVATVGYLATYLALAGVAGILVVASSL